MQQLFYLLILLLTFPLVSHKALAIVGGSIVGDGSVIQASTVELNSSGETCSGSIVGKAGKYSVITASHCIIRDRKFLQIRFKKSNQIIKTIRIGKRKIIFHPRADLAVIPLHSSLPVGFSSARLVNSQFIPNNCDATTISGYGTTGQAERLDGYLREKNLLVSGYSLLSGVASLESSNGGSCYGDSGGPAFTKVGNEFTLWGVSSFVESLDNTLEGMCLGISVYTNLAQYQEWLFANL